MGWEFRERGSRYYTRSIRVNGRVTRQYLGSGAVAQAIAYLDEKDRMEREEKARKERAGREELEALDRTMEELDRAADVLMKAHLIAAGYHRHNKGEWRKRRA